MRPQTDRQTDTQTWVTTIHFASSTTHAKCNYNQSTNVQNNISVTYYINGVKTACCL